MNKIRVIQKTQKHSNQFKIQMRENKFRIYAVKNYPSYLKNKHEKISQNLENQYEAKNHNREDDQFEDRRLS